MTPASQFMKRLTLASFLFLTSALQVAAAPVSFFTALPVYQGGLMIQEHYMSMPYGPSMGQSMDAWAVSNAFAYGVTSKLAVIADIPYMDKSLSMSSMGTNINRGSSGIGDSMALLRYQIFERDSAGSTLRGALLGGLQVPTGSSRLSDQYGRLPAMLQPGSGAYDPIAGTVWTAQWLIFEFDADAMYQRNAWANNFKFGDSMTEDASVQYRIWPWRRLKSHGVPHFLYAVLEANNIWQARNQAGGIPDTNSGGAQLFVDPGLQWVTQRFALEFVYQIPAVQNSNGTQLQADNRLIAGFRAWF